MKNALIIVSLASLLTVVAAAQEAPVDTIFVPDKDGTGARVLDYETGKEKAVLRGSGKAPPEYCPSGDYWLKDNASIVSCEGVEFELVPLDHAKYPAGWHGLKPKPEPPDGDDKSTKPMPHKREQKPIVND